nr:VWA domain-containing protein [Anaerotignum lactatifermentans]
MAGPTVILTAKDTATVFAVDRSASAQDSLDEITAFLEAAQENRPAGETVGLVSFGAATAVEQLPSEESDLAAGLLSAVDPGGSDLAGAVGLAQSLLPERSAKRVVLLSDGKETVGDLLQRADILAQQGAVLDVYPLEQEERPEVQLTQMELDQVIRKDTRYEIALRLYSTIDTQAVVRLYKENTMIAQENVTVRRGESRLVFSDQTKEGGAVTYWAEIEAAEDTLTQNNRVYNYTYIEDVPRLLIIESEESQWAALLENSMVSVDRVQPAAAPVSAEALSRYDAVILANVDLGELPDGWADTAESYVRTLGGGLIASGGEKAFALGGYQGTVLEEILPVDMDLKTEGQEPDLTMIMVIDRSGSMDSATYGVTRIDMAKEAVIRSLSHFQQGDRVGVIAFDSEASWVVEPQEVTANAEKISSAVASIQASGGTSILPALRQAYDAVSKSETKQKHILLLTDGQAEQSGYDGLLQEMRQRGVTLSAVAVGEDADQTLLERLAEEGGGRYYYTDVFSDLPEIFAKETILAGKEFLNNRSFYPAQKDVSVILDGVERVPQLQGYVSTTAKSRADQVLISDTQEPVLAAWQYGLGRTAVWTPDLSGQWTADWLSQPEGVTILRNLVSWTMKSPMDDSLKMTAAPEQSRTRLRLEMPYEEEIKQVKASVVDGKGKESEAIFSMTSPGVYEAWLDTAAEGAYVASVGKEKEDGTWEYANTGFFISYGAEYDLTKGTGGRTLLEQAAARTGGRVLTSGAEVFSGAVPRTMAERELQKVLLVLALLLFLLDIALHRFTLVTARLEQAASSLHLPQRKAGTKKTAKAEKKKPEEPLPRTEGAKAPAEEKETISTAQKLAQSRKKRGK